MALGLLSFHIPVLWLKPEVDIISRDRGGNYAAAAKKGAPQARAYSRSVSLARAPHRRLFRFLSEKGGVESKDP